MKKKKKRSPLFQKKRKKTIKDHAGSLSSVVTAQDKGFLGTNQPVHSRQPDKSHQERVPNQPNKPSQPPSLNIADQSSRPDPLNPPYLSNLSDSSITGTTMKTVKPATKGTGKNTGKDTAKNTGKDNNKKETEDGGLGKNILGKAVKKAKQADCSNRFILEKRLGDGGLCEVFQASDSLRTSWGDANAQLAVKKILPEFVTNSKAGQLMMQEFAILRQLTHHNIIKSYDIHMTRWGLAITMELLQGLPLTECIQAHPLGMGKGILPLAQQLFSALAYLHEQGIAHGDVKPGNLTLEQGKRLVLFDFNSATTGLLQGHAEKFNNATLREDLQLKTYSPLYASPERIETGQASVADDVFSAAATLYHLAYGQRPFPQETALAAREAKVSLCIPDKALPYATQKMLEKALSFTPAERPTAQECLRAIRQMSFGQRVSTFWRKPDTHCSQSPV